MRKVSLVGVANVGNFDGLDEDATIDDIKKNMFDAENVVVDKNGDHGLSKLTHYDPVTMSAEDNEKTIEITNTR